MNKGSKLIAIGGEANTSDSEVHEDIHERDEIAPSEAGLIEESEEWTEAWIEDSDAPERDWSWLVPTFACLTIAGWTGFFGWVHHREMFARASPAQWSEWVGAWSVPVLLVIAVWLLAMRNSRSESRRFGNVAATLSQESALLETRLVTVNRELSVAREFLAAQSRDLESLGRTAGESLSDHADHLQSLIRSNGEQLDAIGTVSTTALKNMEQLRNDLPVVANSARDVSNQIGNAGRTANSQVNEMIVGFERLNEFGQTSERWTDSLSEKVSKTLAEFGDQIGQLDGLVADRFAALREQSETFQSEIDVREDNALAALRNRSEALSEELGSARSGLDEEEEQALKSLRVRFSGLRDEAKTVGNSLREEEESAFIRLGQSIENMQDRLSEAVATLSRIDEQALAGSNGKLQRFLAEAEAVDEKLAVRESWFQDLIEEYRSRINNDEAASIDILEKRFAAFDEAIGTRSAKLQASAEDFSERGNAIAAKLDEFRGEIATLAEQGSDTEQLLSVSIEALSEKLVESRDALDGTGSHIAELTEASVRLLELVRGAAERSRDDLPASMGEAEIRLQGLRDNVSEMHDMLDDAAVKSRSLSDYMIISKSDGQEAAEAITALHTRLAEAGTEHAEKLRQLSGSVKMLGEESDAVSQRAQGDLHAAIAMLEDAITGTTKRLAETTASNIREFASKVGDETAEAVDKALRQRTDEAVLQLEDHAVNAANVSREATIQLRDQLARVNELTGNLETRVDRARERAEEQVNNDFSRRVALITESLNSNAIDISKGLSSEVSDTAWASYLRGDRGIFTRRAVSLLDSTEARDIAAVYDADADFRAHVSRYIHDFEAMLRTMLSTRDGNALSVTLLSSDMGKLYVALAQAIERLRE